MNVYLKKEQNEEKVYDVDKMTVYNEKDRQYEINVTLSKMGMPYRIVLKYTPSDAK